jgi:hypothetical protein
MMQHSSMQHSAISGHQEEKGFPAAAHVLMLPGLTNSSLLSILAKQRPEILYTPPIRTLFKAMRFSGIQTRFYTQTFMFLVLVLCHTVFVSVAVDLAPKAAVEGRLLRQSMFIQVGPCLVNPLLVHVTLFVARIIQVETAHVGQCRVPLHYDYCKLLLLLLILLILLILLPPLLILPLPLLMLPLLLPCYYCYSASAAAAVSSSWNSHRHVYTVC